MKMLIVDDHPVVLVGLSQLLQGRYPQAQLVLAGTGAQAIDLLMPHRDIDLVLLDYQLEDMTGLEVLREFARVRAQLAVLVVSGSTNPHLMQQTIEAGALGFVLKSGSIDEMFKAVELALRGESYVPPELQAFQLLERSGGKAIRARLSMRQEEVLYGLMDGQTNRHIAQALGLSDETIKNHVSAILRHFEADNRTQAVVAASDAGYRRHKAQ
ncbi:MAG: response regulator transcription factor [Rhodoferax sp.]|nr:response regulator transcription factor [Rhodoferax sp.]